MCRWTASESKEHGREFLLPTAVCAEGEHPRTAVRNLWTRHAHLSGGIRQTGPVRPSHWTGCGMTMATQSRPVWLILVCATIVSPARLELLQTESHLLPQTASSTTRPIKARELTKASASPLELDREQPISNVARRVLVAPMASEPAPTAMQRLLHPFRRLAAEMIASSSATRMQPMELVMTCSVIGMGLVGIAWYAHRAT